MTDERAVQLANLLAEYTRASQKEGATAEEVADWTIGALLADIVDTTPDHLEHTLDRMAVRMAEGERATETAVARAPGHSDRDP
jgi:hypothetical protein